MSKVCPKCGYTNGDDAKFCSKCGALQLDESNITSNGNIQQDIASLMDVNNSSGSKGLPIAALVLGIVATVLAWFYMVNILALICGIVGLVCAVLGRKKQMLVGRPTGMATAGLVLSIVGTSLATIGFLSCTVCVCAGISSIPRYYY